jgi:hypothetical protein
MEIQLVELFRRSIIIAVSIVLTTDAMAADQLKIGTSDYIITSLVRERLYTHKCGAILNLKPKARLNTKALTERARKYLNATERDQLNGSKLEEALLKEAEQVLNSMHSSLHVFQSERENCLVLFGYITGRAAQARDTYTNLGGAP